jgi:Cu/Ag efflux protein CusF
MKKDNSVFWHLSRRLMGLLCCALMVAAFSLQTACRAGNAPQIKQYDLQGRVEAIDKHRSKITIAHDRIKGYMEAMTMEFGVRDEQLPAGLSVGDFVQAKLVFDGRAMQSWLERLSIMQKSEPASADHYRQEAPDDSLQQSKASGPKRPSKANKPKAQAKSNLSNASAQASASECHMRHSNKQ